MESGHAPIGAWFSQLGRLHEVHHVSRVVVVAGTDLVKMWHYPSLEARREKRQQAWQIDSWSATVTKVRLSRPRPSLESTRDDENFRCSSGSRAELTWLPDVQAHYAHGGVHPQGAALLPHPMSSCLLAARGMLLR